MVVASHSRSRLSSTKNCQSDFSFGTLFVRSPLKILLSPSVREFSKMHMAYFPLELCNCPSTQQIVCSSLWRPLTSSSGRLSSHELLFYPRYHLNQSSLLCLKPLLTNPMVMDVYRTIRSSIVVPLMFNYTM